MKKVDQTENIKIIIDDSYCNSENILKECGKLINEVTPIKKEEK